MSLPSADDLFRPTADNETAEVAQNRSEQEPASAEQAESEPEQTTSRRRSSGRVRHDEKMTIYVTAAELLDIEHARLALRRDHGLAVDRGRLVREAVAIALAELDSDGIESTIVQRLSAN